jgi:hypothetical protein
MSEADAEVAAIQTIVAALTPLDAEARGRVLSYVFGRLGLRASVSGVASGSSSAPSSEGPVSDRPRTSMDIRSLKEEKQPETAIEMAALVAYYLSEVAGATEAKSAVDADDLKKYFKQAQFPLPQKLHMTLVHTKNAGYFDSVGAGQYKLNPVGYNLIAYNLPSSKAGDKTSGARRAKGSRKRSKR